MLSISIHVEGYSPSVILIMNHWLCLMTKPYMIFNASGTICFTM